MVTYTLLLDSPGNNESGHRPCIMNRPVFFPQGGIRSHLRPGNNKSQKMRYVKLCQSWLRGRSPFSFKPWTPADEGVIVQVYLPNSFYQLDILSNSYIHFIIIFPGVMRYVTFYVNETYFRAVASFVRCAIYSVRSSISLRLLYQPISWA